MKKLYIIQLLTNLCFVSNIMNIYFEHIGFSFTQIGVLFGLLQFSKFVFEIPTGFFADKYGRQTSLCIGLILEILGFISMIFASNLFLHGISIVCLGCAYTFSTGTLTALRVDVCKEEKISLLHANTVCYYLYYFAYGFSALFAGILAQKNFYYIFLINIVTLFISLIVLLTLKSNACHTKDITLNIKETIRYIFSNKSLFYYISIGFTIDFVMMPIDGFYNNYLHNDFHFNYISIGFITALQFFIQGLFSYFSEQITKKFNKIKLVQYSPILMMFLFLLFSLTTIPIVAIILYIFATCIFASYISVFDTFKQNIILSKYRSSTLSFGSLLVALGSACSKYLYGYLSDKIGMHITMIVFVVFAFLSLIVINILYRNQRNALF